MPRWSLVVGTIIALAGAYLVFSPLTVATALHRPHETTSQMINLRASWGGTLVGLGVFIAWGAPLQPWPWALVRVLLCLMAAIGAARAVGFALDGRPDALQWFWVVAEGAIVTACVVALMRRGGHT